jgi:hypothetical protein
MKKEVQCSFLCEQRAEVGNFVAAKDLDQPMKICQFFKPTHESFKFITDFVGIQILQIFLCFTYDLSEYRWTSFY